MKREVVVIRPGSTYELLHDLQKNTCSDYRCNVRMTADEPAWQDSIDLTERTYLGATVKELEDFLISLAESGTICQRITIDFLALSEVHINHTNGTVRFIALGHAPNH